MTSELSFTERDEIAGAICRSRDDWASHNHQDCVDIYRRVIPIVERILDAKEDDK